MRVVGFVVLTTTLTVSAASLRPQLRSIKHHNDRLLELRGGATGEFKPLEAVLGGAFIGAASGMSMMAAGRVAGNSGALKSVVKGDADEWKLSYIIGLVAAGAAMSKAMPTLLESTPNMDSVSSILKMALGGLAVGAGTNWANGCTSGHGLCGLSRLSLRSLVAVPTFMAFAIAARTIETGASFSLLPMLATTTDVVSAAKALALGFGGSLVLIQTVLAKSLPRLAKPLLGLWSGALFGVGLVVGGMARPSAVTGALSPAALDLTLWCLFTTGLLVTFGFYRVAEAKGVGAARASAQQSSADITKELVVGSAMFGVGWAMTGLCPGPLAVGFGAAPLAPGILVCLAAFTAGVKLTS